MFLPLAVVYVAVVCIFAKQKKLGKLNSPKLNCLKLNLDSRICKSAETRGSGQKVGQVHSRICKYAETRGSGQKVGQVHSRICKSAETRGSGQKVGQVDSRICKYAETRHGPMGP